MNKIILLAGNSQRNSEWQDNLAGVFMQHEDMDVITPKYSHWQSGDDFMNFEIELNKLKGLDLDDSSYSIVAKSAGILLSAMAIEQSILDPERCVFIGFPLSMANDHKELFSPLEKLGLPVTVIQNRRDPLGSYQEVKDHFGGLDLDAKVVRLEGDSHAYLDLDKLKELTSV